MINKYVKFHKNKNNNNNELSSIALIFASPYPKKSAGLHLHLSLCIDHMIDSVLWPISASPATCCWPARFVEYTKYTAAHQYPDNTIYIIL